MRPFRPKMFTRTVFYLSERPPAQFLPGRGGYRAILPAALDTRHTSFAQGTCRSRAVVVVERQLILSGTRINLSERLPTQFPPRATRYRAI
jgi:hypothetical protein